MLSTKLSLSNSSNGLALTLDSSILSLYKRESKNALKLTEAGLLTIKDLLWIIPLRTEIIPPIASFTEITPGKMFQGRGNIVSVKAFPNFRAKGRRGALLYNLTVYLKDYSSEQTIAIKWFNTYSSQIKKFKEISSIKFFGTPQIYSDSIQLINPTYSELTEEISSVEMLQITYPTINGVSGEAIKDVISRIPDSLWNKIPENISLEVIKRRNLIGLSESLKIIHGKIPSDNYSEELFSLAKKRLIYQELFLDQIKIIARKKLQKNRTAPIIQTTHEALKKMEDFFPFKLTRDQKVCLSDITGDLSSGNPMMRLIQGDVGTGKTAVATIASLLVTTKGQVALMCPTESLATQHFRNLAPLFAKNGRKAIQLIGSLSAKEKREISQKIETGEVDFVVGTHAIIQEGVRFKNLVLAIIDEQHKFGVDQRLKLASKNSGVHSLIMTATPIPRSLSLTQYGDLDISIIREIPEGRKGIKTKIITPENFANFLTFIKTRISMKEQVYIVTPAIIDNEENDFLALEEVFAKFSKLFPNEKIRELHGKMRPADKEATLIDFADGKVDILIATSVIEVGINVPNATVMAVINPERFGLSSLHQLRGRVGRGEKPGFCFLVTDRQIGDTSMERLKVIEGSTDGFLIAEEDLRIRGEGDLFGTAQAGNTTSRRLSSIIHHQDILAQARDDLFELIEQKDPFVQTILKEIEDDPRVLMTV